MSSDSILSLARTLAKEHDLPDTELKCLLSQRNEEVFSYLREQAVLQCRAFYHGQVFIRGLIEISSFCKNDCYYCGIRRSRFCGIFLIPALWPWQFGTLSLP